MTTRIYGYSDDLIEFEGDVQGEADYYGSGKEDDPGILITCSDGTVLLARFKGHWVFELIENGVRFARLEHDCGDEAHFHDGLKWIYVSTSRWWKRVEP